MSPVAKYIKMDLPEPRCPCEIQSPWSFRICIPLIGYYFEAKSNKALNASLQTEPNQAAKITILRKIIGNIFLAAIRDLTSTASFAVLLGLRIKPEAVVIASYVGVAVFGLQLLVMRPIFFWKAHKTLQSNKTMTIA